MPWYKKAGHAVKGTVHRVSRTFSQAARDVSHATSHVANQVANLAPAVVQPVVQVIPTVVQEVVHVVPKVLHESTAVIHDVLHEANKGVRNIIETPKKIRNAISYILVEKDINASFKEKMHEAIKDAEKELAEKKEQDKAQIRKTIDDKINEVTQAYRNQTGKAALDDAEEQFTEALRLVTAAVCYDCRFGFKETIEEIISLELDDYAVVKFMEKRPLRLALANLADHQRTDALSVLLPHFDKNLDTLSLENKNDYSVLKAHAEPLMGGNVNKAEESNYFAKMLEIVSRDTNAGIIRISDNGVMISRNDIVVENAPAVSGLRL